jgi:hypothetical protein
LLGRGDWAGERRLGMWGPRRKFSITAGEQDTINLLVTKKKKKKKKKNTRERQWFGDGEENEKKAFLFYIWFATKQSKVLFFFS